MSRHIERHFAARIGWLRAAVLGANDGIVSTASLVLGVAAAQATPPDVMVAGVAGLVAGAMSMAAGEYVSVSSQADTEKADLERERRELRRDSRHDVGLRRPIGEGDELVRLSRAEPGRGAPSAVRWRALASRPTAWRRAGASNRRIP